MSQDSRRKRKKCSKYFIPVSSIVWYMQWCVHVSIYVMSLDWLADINQTLVRNTEWQSKGSYKGLQ